VPPSRRWSKLSEAVERDDRDDALDMSPDESPVATVLSNGDALRSWVSYLTELGFEEVTVRFGAQTVTTRAVDPANVALADVTAYARGFEGYDLADDAVTVGLNLERFESAVGWARRRGDGDPVRIDVLPDPTRIRVAVTRPDQSMQRVTTWFEIDPDSIRERPNVPDLNLPCEARPGVRALHDGLMAVAPTGSHIEFTRDGDDMVLSRDGESLNDAVRFTGAVTTHDGENPRSKFSTDYLRDIVSALKARKADRVTVRWGEEFPTMLDWEQNDWGFEGCHMVAPRIQSDE